VKCTGDVGPETYITTFACTSQVNPTKRTITSGTPVVLDTLKTGASLVRNEQRPVLAFRS